MFLIDTTALWVVLFFLFAFLFFYFRKKKSTPSLSFSNLEPLKEPRKSLRSRLSSLPNILYFLALLFFLLAFIDPHYENPKQTIPLTKEGIAVYLILDQSGSMKEQVRGVRQTISKLDLLKNVTKDFIQQRQNDLIGIVSFARSATVLSPLTLDHQQVQKQLNALTFVPSKEQEGTAIGYAIYKTTTLINAMTAFEKETSYKIQSSIMILVTDGFQDVNPLDRDNRLRSIDLQEASDFAKNSKVKLYVINVEPLLATEKFAPHRRLLKRITENTGGKFYITEGTQTLDAVYKEINQLEKSPIPTETFPPTRSKSFYPLLLSLGLIAFVLAHFLNTTFLRKIP